MLTEATKLRFLIFAVIMAGFCPVFLISMFGETRIALSSSSWPSSLGVITDVVAKPWTDSDGRQKWFGRTVYSYAVDGKDYTSDLTDFSPGEKRSDMAEALADVRQFHPGLKVDVYYNPADPSVAVISRGLPAGRAVLLIAVAAVGLVSIVFTILTARSWLRSRRKSADDPRFSAA
jgi:hypothetical protein